jgi:fermentation-respiration switch protein FrsA (DUF1100 family)
MIVGTLLIINLFIVPFLEPGMIYFPTKEIGKSPASIGIEYEDVYLETTDGIKINGWFIENKASDKVILHFHGNGGNLSNRLAIIQFLYNLPANIFIIDYHGYGKSQGKPSEKNLYLDAKAAYDFLVKKKKFPPSHVIVSGSSLGGGVATELASREKIGGLILLRTFTAIPDMAPRSNPLYRWPIVWIRSKYDNIGKIGKIDIPVLIVHSKKDEIIPYQMSVRLFEKANQPKKLILFEEGGHNNLIASPEYIMSLKKMLGD